MSTYYLQPFIWAPTANHTLPSFYWNVYSNEQRIKYLCMCLDDLMKYQDSVSDAVNKLTDSVNTKLTEFQAKIDKQIDDFTEQITNQLAEQDENVTESLKQMKIYIDSEFQRFSFGETTYDVTTGEYRPSYESMRRLFQALSYDNKGDAQLVSTYANMTVEEMAKQTVYNVAYSNLDTITINKQPDAQI